MIHATMAALATHVGLEEAGLNVDHEQAGIFQGDVRGTLSCVDRPPKSMVSEGSVILRVGSRTNIPKGRMI